MLDGWARRKLDPLLNRIAAGVARGGIGADAVTLAGCGIGLAAAALVAVGWFGIAFVLIVLSRLADGVDGAVARINGPTDLGGFLDIVLDFLFYGAVPLGFVLFDPAANGVAGAVLLFAFYVNGASFLTFAVMAEKRRLVSTARGSKSLFFTTGIAEAGETLAVFLLACLFPAWFPVLAYAFASITLYTALSRIVLAGRELR
ncbi:CDP-alcohol phosphatidyltransferase family protein [Nitratireductor thuwali]|uniref:Inner membrane protein YnjF n=1 Tax=Nitratireductor thuwali TaxID=2267699 RepID=A0ABY5MML5_9HYPH|nr:Inner membrane protein YnjF [Nitratireductor thuwali]